MKKLARKGNSNMVVQAIVALGVGVIVIAVIAIMLGAFRTDLTANSYEYNVTTRGLTFLDNATSKFATAGTIVGVLFLLAIIAGGGVLGYMGYQKLKN